MATQAQDFDIAGIEGDTEADIAAVERLVAYLQSELARLRFPLAAQQCRFIQLAMIEQTIAEARADQSGV